MYKPKFNAWHRGQRHRFFVTLFPHSVAPGLNLIAYGLMPSRPVLPFETMMRFEPHRRALARSKCTTE